MRSRMDPHYIIHNLYFMYMIWSTKNKPFRDCSLWYRGCYAIGWAIEGCPGKGILDNPHIFIHIYTYLYTYLYIFIHISYKNPRSFAEALWIPKRFRVPVTPGPPRSLHAWPARSGVALEDAVITLWLFNSSPWKMAHRNRWFTY